MSDPVANALTLTFVTESPQSSTGIVERTTERTRSLSAPMVPSPLAALVRLLVVVCALFASDAWAQGTGTVAGRVFDADSGDPIAAATVVLEADGDAAAGEPRQEVGTTDAEGAFRFDSLPAGSYRLSFAKSGYSGSRLEDIAVRAGQTTRADFPLPRMAAGTADQILELDAFVIEASTLEDGADLLELRLDADQFLNTLSAEEFSKFAASDVADALRRVAGVNVVGGQFAVIRGLEDRYNSTLYNGAPVPSPDPDRQSVQLDLFPSDIVSNLVVSKTFVPELPSNTSGGGIDVITHDYPEQFEIKISGGGGFETKAADRFLRLNDGSPVGTETDWQDVLESDFGGSVGGRKEFFGREFRFKGLLNQEIDYRTAEGFQESREPRLAQTRRGEVLRSGDLALGELSLSSGRFELTESERAEQRTGYAGLGFDIDESGDHRIDGSIFYTRKDEEIVQLKEHGFFPGLDYEELGQAAADGLVRSSFEGAATPTAWLAGVREFAETPSPSRGPAWFASFFESESFQRERDLLVYQVNGDHRVPQLDGLHLSWAANQARTTQEELSRGARIWFEPDDLTQIPTEFPTTPESLGPGSFFAGSPGIFFSQNDIEETQDFVRIDADYERNLGERVTVRLNGGYWYESADRDVESSFLETPSSGGGTQFAFPGETIEDLGEVIFDSLQQSTDGVLSGTRDTSNESTREITAWNLGAKATFLEKLDVTGGVRVEQIFIESLNDAFTGEFDPFDGTPRIFPTAYLFFDRRDNPGRPIETPTAPPGTVFNDELLGIDVPIDPVTGLVDLVDRAEIDALVNGEIDEAKTLPSLGLTYRPLQGLNIRGAWSQTVARPSFREMGYYVSVDPGSDDLIIGNPQLQLSDVQSWDARVEYTWGAFGDLAAVSVFYKTIEDPIESIVVRNPANFEASSSALYRTFFNNPNEGTLMGVELEARKNLSFLPRLDFAQYFSVGGNFTYIDAEVDRTEAELARSQAFFGVADGDRERFGDLSDSRRLFGQPEWIANLDLSFDQPDWGTKVTLAFFAISDVLDAAGSASIGPDGSIFSFTLDRYVDSFHQLDLVASQVLRPSWLPGELTLKASAKNLTNSARGIIYDPDQTRDEIAERSYKIGRDYSFSLSYTFSF